MKRGNMTDRITGFLLLVFALWFGYHALQLKEALFSDPVGSRAFPLAVAALLAPLAVILMVRPGPVSGKMPSPRAWPPLIVSLVTLILYAALLKPLGFIVATILSFQLLALVFGAPFWKGFLASAVTTLVLYVLFAQFLDLYLPPGDIFRGWLI